MTSEQCRAARALLAMSQDDLAAVSGVAKRTIADVERATRRSPHRSTLAALQRALEAAGVEFITENGGGPGVRLRKEGSDQ
ncbi:MAG: helix-turn-helix domain-containing protein [Pseudomonadota bacterium]